MNGKQLPNRGNDRLVGEVRVRFCLEWSAVTTPVRPWTVAIGPGTVMVGPGIFMFTVGNAPYNIATAVDRVLIATDMLFFNAFADGVQPLGQSSPSAAVYALPADTHGRSIRSGRSSA